MCFNNFECLHSPYFIFLFILFIVCLFTKPIWLLLSKDTALDPGEDVALLSVSFEDAEATQVFPKLYLSPSIEQ